MMAVGAAPSRSEVQKIMRLLEVVKDPEATRQALEKLAERREEIEGRFKGLLAKQKELEQRAKDLDMREAAIARKEGEHETRTSQLAAWDGDLRARAAQLADDTNTYNRNIDHTQADIHNRLNAVRAREDAVKQHEESALASLERAKELRERYERLMSMIRENA